MHSLSNESVIPVSQIRGLPMFTSRKPRLSLTTVYNWTRGLHKTGVKLESFWIGRRLYTSLEALDRFIQAHNVRPPLPSQAEPARPSAPPVPAYMDIAAPVWPLPVDNDDERVKLLPVMVEEPADERVVILPEEDEERVQLATEVVSPTNSHASFSSTRN